MSVSVAIIGGGASGLAAAYWAALNGADVTVFEGNDKIGKKLKASGNGRCNFTNLLMSEKMYFGGEGTPQSIEFIKKVLSSFTPKDAIAFFERLGVPSRSYGDYVYPCSEEASSVVYAFLDTLTSMGVKFIMNCRVEGIDYYPNTNVEGGFSLKNNFVFDAVILCCGGRAHPKTGSDGAGYELATSFGHGIKPVRPALTGLYIRGKDYKFDCVRWKGVRIRARITLLSGNKVIRSESGELQLTEYGISGIPVFQLSRIAGQLLSEGKKTEIDICFIPDIIGIPGDFKIESLQKQVFQWLLKRKKIISERMARDFLGGVLPARLGEMLMKISINNIKEIRVSQLSEKELKKLAELLCHFRVEVLKTNDFEHSQCTAGGVVIDEVNPETMESRIRKNLYFAGEILDIDGICGGYNLHFAWASAYLAGCACAASRRL